MTEPALDPARSPLLPPPANPLSGPPADSLSGPPAGAGSFAASALDTGAYDTGAINTASPNRASPHQEFLSPAQSNPAVPDRKDDDVTDVDEADEPSPVTPIFRAGSELPDPNKRRGPRHRAPEPVTSLLTRRKF